MLKRLSIADSRSLSYLICTAITLPYYSKVESYIHSVAKRVSEKERERERARDQFALEDEEFTKHLNFKLFEPGNINFYLALVKVLHGQLL
jgi:glycogen synthase